MTIILGGYTDFEQNLLAAAYYVSNQLRKDRVSLSEITERYSIELDPRWVRTALKQFAEMGWSRDGLHNGPIADLRIRLTANGIKEAERIIENKSVVLNRLDPSAAAHLATEDGSYITTEDGLHITTETDVSRPASSAISISSADWTGITTRLQSSPEVVELIASHIADIDRLVDQTGLTNSERQKAKAITESLGLLVASPEPEWKAIATLLTSPSIAAVLNVSAIAQIILKIFGIG